MQNVIMEEQAYPRVNDILNSDPAMYRQVLHGLLAVVGALVLFLTLML